MKDEFRKVTGWGTARLTLPVRVTGDFELGFVFGFFSDSTTKFSVSSINIKKERLFKPLLY